MQCISAVWIIVVTIILSKSDASIVDKRAVKNPPKSFYPADDYYKISSVDQVTVGTELFANKFREAVQKVNDKNYVVSPLSVATVLGMLSYGAAGKTAKELQTALSLPHEKHAAKVGIQNFIDGLSNYKDVELMMANKIYFPYGIKPKANFMEMVTQAYYSETESLDFMSISAAKVINEWCEKHTKNRIKNVIDPKTIGRDTSMILVNAVYFKGSWEEQFNPDSTYHETFYAGGNRPKTVPMMHDERAYNYGELPLADARYIEIPYKKHSEEESVSMFVLLPNKRNGLEQMEKKLGKTLLFDLLNNRHRESVKLTLPKFQVETTTELRGPLSQMGLQNIFLDGDFSEIVDRPRLQISKAIQKAFISVDETGSEAAAVTSIELENKFGYDDPIEFKVDHPFLAIVATTGKSRANLFTVRYTGV